MPSAAARRLYEDQIPSFMSILDPEAEAFDDRGVVAMVDSKFMDMDSTCSTQHLRAMTADHLHRHNDSTSTQNSESADSSPTTTLTTDTSSLSDPSPSSSPDSPVNLIPLNSFPSTTFGGLSSTMNTLSVNESALPLARPMTSPSPRRRNMKGLSIQPPFVGSGSTNLVSEPSSPSFIKPQIPAMKRKPSQLSLNTDTNGLNGNFNTRPITLEMPNSPGLPILQRRSLKHSTSSPHMLSGMKSATFGPAGGMTFPTLSERGESGLSEILRPSKVNVSGNNRASIIMEEDSPIRAQVANRALDFEPFRDESEANEDQKSPGYPDGPIAIYEDNVYLYLEPTADEAAKFDVVINVAREVHNPFNRNSGAGITDSIELQSPIPDTAVTSDSFATAFEYPMEDHAETPTTPKAPSPLHRPEYIHMPWDHNTDIATDLMMLCETIEQRTKEGKRVLVHCQQGASRSASLIIAYGLYQNPGMSVNDAYYAAQSKSRWISPNMKLMYCLQDFQKDVSRKRVPRSAAGSRSSRSPTKHRHTLSADAIDIKPKEPLSAPLPEESPRTTQHLTPDRSPKHSRGKSTPNLEAISPGPSSAPSSFSWSEKESGNMEHENLGKFSLKKLLNPPKFIAPEPEPDRSFPPRSSSFFMPPPSPGKPPATSLGFARAAPSLDFARIPSFDFQPPPSPGFLPPSQAWKPPPSPGFPPSSQDWKPPPSPGFLPLSQEWKPPPSPGFGAHRFHDTSSAALTFSSLDLNSMVSTAEQQPVEPVHNAVHMTRALPEDDALMSPRAEAMTSNPLHDSLGELAGLKFVETPPTPSEGLFSPRETMFPRNPFRPFGRPTQVADPRSPPTKGETPIVRSIDEML
ncbi:dual specificity phosphatase [Xylariales sp. PMI_506]|nr:dual specificity phosphatase [Xylariales sp. PMI_506]